MSLEHYNRIVSLEKRVKDLEYKLTKMADNIVLMLADWKAKVALHDDKR